MRRLSNLTAGLALARLSAGFALAAGLAVAAAPGQAGEPLPPVATSVVTIAAAAPSDAERAEILGMPASGLSGAPATGYTYVIYFPAGTATLTAPARDTLAAIADEVTGLELSRVSLSGEQGLDTRTQVVRDALIEMGVPARWIGTAEPAPADPLSSIGPVSMAPLHI